MTNICMRHANFFANLCTPNDILYYKNVVNYFESKFLFVKSLFLRCRMLKLLYCKTTNFTQGSPRQETKFAKKKRVGLGLRVDPISAGQFRRRDEIKVGKDWTRKGSERRGGRERERERERKWWRFGLPIVQ